MRYGGVPSRFVSRCDNPTVLETLAWTKPPLGSDVQDPLGVELRVSTRMAGQLLHCITTITPRARYYSFLPWCVSDYRTHLKGQPSDRGLEDAIRQREKALALGCVTHHKGASCNGGGVVGSREAQRKWDSTGLDDEFDLRRYRQNGSLAWHQYFNSLVNLGCFEEMEPTEDNEMASDSSTDTGLSPDEIQLTTLGQQLADAYGTSLGRPRVLGELRSNSTRLTLRRVAGLGANGGACELSADGPAEQNLLRELFFDRVGSPGRSHGLRKRSLLLIMDLIRQCADVDVKFDSTVFGDAMLYGATRRDSTTVPLSCPPPLHEVASYWRMFYLHNHMSVALEGAFLGLIRSVEQAERGSVRFESVVAAMGDNTVATTLATVFGVERLRSFLQASPAETFAAAGVRQNDGRPLIADGLTLDSRIAEWRLVAMLREHRWASLPTPAGLAVCLILLAAVVLRFDELREDASASWCAQNVRDPYLDLAPPLLSTWLTQWDHAWWARRWDELAPRLLDRFVVRQHELLGYDKGSGSDSMILHCNDGVLTATGDYDKVTIWNPRLRNAMQILSDLGFIKDSEIALTSDGLVRLRSELAAL